MPITPFHFGPGALLKAAAPGAFSWVSFAFANMLIDLEPVVLFLTTGDPAHPWLHTLPGALIVALVAALPGRPAGEAWLRWWNRQLSPSQAVWLGCPSTIERGAAWTGALAGTLSHLAMDALMHVDVRPLWPLVTDNPWQGLVSMDVLHGAAVASLAAALALFLIRRCVRRWRGGGAT